MGLFSRNQEESVEVPSYLIKMSFLEPIKELNIDFLEVMVLDMSVTSIKIPAKERIQKIREGKTIKTIKSIRPEILFNLIDLNTNERVSLTDCILPVHFIAISKSQLNQEQSAKEVREGKEIITKYVYDLSIFTKRSLQKKSLAYEEYQTELAEEKKRHKEEIEKLRKNYDERQEIILLPYRQNEEKLRQKIEDLNKKIMVLITELPEKQSAMLYEYIKKANKIDDSIGMENG